MSTNPQGGDLRAAARPDAGAEDLRVVGAPDMGEAGSPDLWINDADPADRGRGQADVELLTGDQRAAFEARWRDVQTGFVDEPRGAVDQADALVGEVVDAVTAGFSARRSQLEQRWSDEGEEAATENLRQALRAYREFFDRLLKI